MKKFNTVRNFMNAQKFKSDARFELTFKENSDDLYNQCNLFVNDNENTNLRLHIIFTQIGKFSTFSVYNNKKMALINCMNCENINAMIICNLISSIINNFIEY